MRAWFATIADAALMLASCGPDGTAGATEVAALEKGTARVAELGDRLEASIIRSATDTETRYKDATASAKALLQRQREAQNPNRAQALDEMRALIGRGGLVEQLHSASAKVTADFERALADIEDGAEELAETCSAPGKHHTIASACDNLAQARADLAAVGARVRERLGATEAAYAIQHRLQEKLLAEARRPAMAR